MSDNNTEDDNTTSKKQLVLDLDNTLISAEPGEEIQDIEKVVKEKLKHFEIHNLDDYYIIAERPGLQKFLDYVFENFTVNIWTAASKDYCLFIVKDIILKDHPERKINYIFFDYHCRLGCKKFGEEGYKHLNLLWDTLHLNGFQKNNTIIVDDLKDVYETQPENCINIKEFNFLNEGSEKDEELVDVKRQLEQLVQL